MEFKEAGRDFDTDRIGRYVCALSNVVNLGEAPAGLLIFGVKNKTHSVGGTDYRSVPPDSTASRRRLPMARSLASRSGASGSSTTRAAVWSFSRCRLLHRACLSLSSKQVQRQQVEMESS